MARRMGFIGAGKLATAMAMALWTHGYEVSAVSSRAEASALQLASLVPTAKPVATVGQVAAMCDLVFITTPDGAIEEVARAVRWHSGQGVVHCSGALSLEALASASSGGASIASFHPLQTLSCIETPQEAADRLSGICYALDGDGWLAEFLGKLAMDLGGYVVRVAPEDRGLYHQSAVFACGYVTTLLDAAERMWTGMGLSPQQARSALGALAHTTVTNYRRAGAAESVTGPVARGDSDTVQGQLESLGSRLPSLLPLARELGIGSLAFAPAGERQRLTDVLERYGDANPGAPS